MMTDVGVWRDSLVYVVDPRQRRVSLFDRDQGAFVRSEDYDHRVSRFEWGRDSTTYAMTRGQTSPFLLIQSPRRSVSVSQITSGSVHSIVFDGHLYANSSKVLYVPVYFPVVLSYAPNDTVGGAYPPDYGSVPMPEARTRKEGNVILPPEAPVQYGSTLQDGLLAVRRPGTAADSLEFDLYEADNDLKYRHTLRLPIERSTAAYGKGIVVSARDTTVHIYQVDTSEVQ